MWGRKHARKATSEVHHCDAHVSASMLETDSLPNCLELAIKTRAAHTGSAIMPALRARRRMGAMFVRGDDVIVRPG